MIPSKNIFFACSSSNRLSLRFIETSRNLIPLFIKSSTYSAAFFLYVYIIIHMLFDNIAFVLYACICSHTNMYVCMSSCICSKTLVNMVIKMYSKLNYSLTNSMLIHGGEHLIQKYENRYPQ